jgi:hypothetical protein
MPVYPVAARTASCLSPGCWCHDRVPRYPSDLTDAQWAVLEPRAREVMGELVVAAGRPMVHDLRAVCDAIAYVARNGIEWRALPADFLSVTWNQGPGSGSLRYGLAGNWKESPCPSLSSRTSGPCWAGTS